MRASESQPVSLHPRPASGPRQGDGGEPMHAPFATFAVLRGEKDFGGGSVVEASRGI